MKYDLFDIVVSNSSSNVFAEARNEWYVSSCVDCGDNPEHFEQCVCGKDGIRYCYEIQNKKTGAILYPLGSECIKKFDSKDMNYDMKRLTLITDFNTSMREVIKKRIAGEHQVVSLIWLKKPAILDHLNRLGILTSKDVRFLESIRRKKSLTIKQANYQKGLRDKVSDVLTNKVIERIGGVK